MKYSIKQTLLLVGLAVLLFRLLSFFLYIGSLRLSQIHVEFVQYLIPYIQLYVPLIACGIGACFGALLARQVALQKPVLITIIWILALLPIQIHTGVEAVAVQTVTADRQEAKPIKLAARIIDGQRINDEVLLNNRHIQKAVGISAYDDSWQIRLDLTQEGCRRIREATRQNVGNRIGFFLDGDLKSSPEIMEPLDIPYVMLPMDVSAGEAGRIAEGIMKGR